MGATQTEKKKEDHHHANGRMITAKEDYGGPNAAQRESAKGYRVAFDPKLVVTS